MNKFINFLKIFKPVGFFILGILVMLLLNEALGMLSAKSDISVGFGVLLIAAVACLILYIIHKQTKTNNENN